MTEDITNIAGIEIPSTDPTFLAVVGVHVLLGLACMVTGAVAMLSQKHPGRHPRYGTIYFWCLAGVFLTRPTWLRRVGQRTTTCLFLARCRLQRRIWAAKPGGSIGVIGPDCISLGWEHLTFCSLIAFYVDNGKQLPIWKDLPNFTYWLLPLAVGAPLIVRALIWHPLAQQTSEP